MVRTYLRNPFGPPTGASLHSLRSSQCSVAKRNSAARTGSPDLKFSCYIFYQLVLTFTKEVVGYLRLMSHSLGSHLPPAQRAPSLYTIGFGA